MTKMKFLLFKKDLQLKVTGNCQEVKSTYSKSKKQINDHFKKFQVMLIPEKIYPMQWLEKLKRKTGINTEFQSVVAFR